MESRGFAVIILLVVLSLVFPPSVFAADVFVNPDAASDGNGNFATPYKYWSSVTFSSANDYWQLSGTEAEVTANVAISLSGTAENRITVGAYYDNNGSPGFGILESRPIIRRNNYNPGNVTFHITGDYVQLLNLDIRCGETSVSNSGDHTLIEHCLVGENSKFGIRTWGSYITIRYNVIDAKEEVYSQTSYDGVNLANGSHHGQVYRNVFVSWHHNQIILMNSDNNSIYENTGINPHAINMRFIGYHNGSDYNDIYKNWWQDMDSRSQFDGGQYNEAYKNIVFRMTDSTAGGENEGAAFWSQGVGGYESKYNKYYNNIIYDVDREAFGFYNNSGDGDIQYNEVYDNVILNVGSGFPFFDIDVNTNGVLQQTVQDNILYNTGGTGDYIDHRGTSRTTVQFNDATGYDTTSGNQFIDPLFTDPANGDFTFKTGSPCITAGIDEVVLDVLTVAEVTAMNVVSSSSTITITRGAKNVNLNGL